MAHTLQVFTMNHSTFANFINYKADARCLSGGWEVGGLLDSLRDSMKEKKTQMVFLSCYGKVPLH